MKGILLIALSLLSSLVFSDTIAVENILYTGVSQVEEINMSTEKTRTVYRRVTVPATCYRTEYRQQCQQAPPRCHTECNGRGNCRSVCMPGGVICSNIPVSIPYPCTRVETRPVQVHDYYVQTKAQFHFSTDELPEVVRENISLKMVGETPSLQVNGSNNYFLILDHDSKQESMSAGTKSLGSCSFMTDS